MTKFVKEIVREGEYLVSTAAGTRKKKSFNKDDLNKYADTGKKMLSAGLKIPAPRQHTVEAQPELQEADPKEGYENLGFWNDFYVAKDEQGKYALYGVLDAPGDPEDEATPAGIVSRTARDTSICVHDFNDGLGRKWEDAIWHVAIPTHPIEPGQKNFIPLPNEYEVITMSQMVSKVDINKLLSALSECGISLPTDTTEDDFMDRLYVAVTQKSKNYDNNSSLRSKPNNSKVETYPIMMSLNQDQVKAILEAGVIDPATGKPFEASTFKDDGVDTDKLKKSIIIMSTVLDKNFKERYQDRVRNLVTSNRVTREYAEANLLPMIEALKVSDAVMMGVSSEGDLPKNAVEVTLSALESLPGNISGETVQKNNDHLWMSNRPSGATSVPNPHEVSKVSDEEANDIISTILSV